MPVLKNNLSKPVSQTCTIKTSILTFIAVSVTSVPMTGAAKEVILERVSCIRYLVRFSKDQVDIQALIDLGSEVNAMHPAYAKKPTLLVRKTDVRAQKIDESCPETFVMAIAGFSVKDKLGEV